MVMAKKKDGSHIFCVDCCQLNVVTKIGPFPFLRIDNQLGRSKFFTTLDI